MNVVRKEKRLFFQRKGSANLIDLLLVLAVSLLALVAYHRLSAPHRPAPAFAAKQAIAWTELELQLSDETPWMANYAQAGCYKEDPRSGDRIVEVLSNALAPEGVRVRMKVRAVSDGQGRLLFDNRDLLPGQRLRIVTNCCVLEGVIVHVRAAGE